MKARRLNLPIAWSVTALVSLAVGLGITLASKAADCGPGQIDGQWCGTGTFVGIVFGVLAGLLIFVGMGIYFLLVARKRRRSGRFALEFS